MFVHTYCWRYYRQPSCKYSEKPHGFMAAIATPDFGFYPLRLPSLDAQPLAKYCAVLSKTQYRASTANEAPDPRG
jgi:hypothetical protein